MKFFCALFVLLPALAVAADNTNNADYFEKHVRPVFVAKCQGCHNAKAKMAGLDLETGAGVTSPVVESKDKWADSRLLHAISYEERLKMPPTGKLKPDEIAAITEWVKTGATWPGSAQTATAAAAPTGNGVRNWSGGISPEDRKFWAFQPISNPTPPAGANNPIDAFLLAKLQAANLKPAPPASKETLLRRATYDLTGLPPTESEMAAFLADQSPKAFEKVVDRLLASPRYGEKWGRHWLDIARYADSTGNDEDHRYPYAWRYRDYVIEAFNSDLPYDQFVREQLAGDLLPAPPGSTTSVNRRGLVATGFLSLGPKALASPDKKKMLVDVWDEQIDVTGRAFLGLTVACARCHDHKFDPIQTKDYYSMMGMFASTTDFEDTKGGVAKMLYVPLVERDVYAKYKTTQASADRKRARRELLEEQQLLALSEKWASRIADFMLASEKVRTDKLDSSTVAKEANLDPRILDKWVKFLDPVGAPPYLDKWTQAAAPDRAKVAAAYQRDYEEQLAAFSQKIVKWRDGLAKAEDKQTAPPGKPGLTAEKLPFFHAVYAEDIGPLNVKSKDYATVYGNEMQAQIEKLRKEEKAAREGVGEEPDMACAVKDGPVIDQKVYIRGDYASEGEPAPKVFPAVLRSEHDPVVPAGASGRRELAEWLANPTHPLTARVMVNRIWLGHFGEGIVRTPDNFGRMGERPTHPELLDWLATQFITNGWSVKKMHRLMMLSSAYQMSSSPSPEAVAADPENRLLQHFNRRRLAVEEIRDGMLAIDGSIDLTMGGTLQKGFGTDGENSNGRLSLNPEKIKRRMVYLPLRRSNLPSLLNLFDFGDAVTPSGRRVLTNVAPQALFAMNSGFIQERAKAIADALPATASPNERMSAAYRRILNRAPSASEIDDLLSYMTSFRKKFPSRDEAAAWQSACHILLASNEFLYVD